MAESENVNGIIGRLMAVQRYVPGIPEADQQFAQFRRFGKRTPDISHGLQQQKLPINGLRCPLGNVRVLAGKETATPLQPPPRPFSHDYSWHSGTVVSLSSPQVFSQLRTSLPVR